MIALLPLFFSPDEPLGTDPELALDLATRTARTLRAVLSLQDEGSMLVVAHDAYGAGLLEATIHDACQPNLMLSVESSQLPESRTPLPPGTRRAVSAMGNRRYGQTVLALDPRNSSIDNDILNTALISYRSTQPRPLLSAVACEDHPCQAKVLYSYCNAFRKLGDGAEIEGISGGASITVHGPQPSGPYALDLRWQGDILRIFPDPGQPMRFTLPKGIVPGDAPQWSLLQHVIPACKQTVLLPIVSENVPWRWNPDLRQIVNIKQDMPVSGRQAFPEVLEPDGSFCIFDEGFDPDQDLQGEIGVFALSTSQATLITDPLSLLKWRLIHTA